MSHPTEIKSYDPQAIERKWQAYWQQQGTFAAADPAATDKPKYYVLDMFPYPSGAGLHVGHPLGYIATDILARYKRLKGYNVLHPMGFDAFGLPAEQYAIQTGTHPALTTRANINTYKQQLGRLGMAYSHSPDQWPETSDPHYYTWTQQIFLHIFNSWYNPRTEKAEPIETLYAIVKKEGFNKQLRGYDHAEPFTAAQWAAMGETERHRRSLDFRLAYNSLEYVNWCEALGTVLSNDEVKDGLSERGGYPVERREMRQWSMRITAYAERLLRGLDDLQWPDSIQEQQRNWIGKSVGAEIDFAIDDAGFAGQALKVFTTRPDTIYGCTFMVIAPEHPLAERLGQGTHKAGYEEYRQRAANRSERERQMDVKTVSGAFSGSFAKHPFTGKRLPIYTAEYVLAGYGTGAIMAVPAHDQRDWSFARHFNLEIVKVYDGDINEGAIEDKTGTAINSDFLNGLSATEAIARAITEVEKKGMGKGKTTYRLRDAIFARQRYWGEPIPIIYRDGMPYALPESELPLTLPDVPSYKPAGTGESPLAALQDWVHTPAGTRETNTMPGWAGSSWYFMRYTDIANTHALAEMEKLRYWLPVDLYVGGSEHAVGHLLYSRFWTKILYDLSECPVDEPFKKLVNQGMIQGRSNFVYFLKENPFSDELYLVSKEIADKVSPFKGEAWFGDEEDKALRPDKQAVRNMLINIGVSAVNELRRPFPTIVPNHVDVGLVENDYLDVQAFLDKNNNLNIVKTVLNNEEKYLCGWEIEKMSKSKYNVVNPDDLCAKYGADTFRMYEMFLGPLELSKPWNTNGITGVSGFVKKWWKLFYDESGKLLVTDEAPTPEELKLLHQTLKKVEEDCENLSFNTTVPQFMICCNELTRLKCCKRAVLQPLVVALAPYAPHLAEELWVALGNSPSVFAASFPAWDAKYLVESAVEYPVSINGKVRFKVTLPADMPAAEVEAQVRAQPELAKYVNGLPIKKVIVVPGKIVNVVV